jgi:ATP-binding cassette, subfamily B, bacterial
VPAERLAFTLHRRSVLPGRERWHVAELRGNPRLSSSVAERLRARTGVTGVTVNPEIGSILICTDPEAGPSSTEQALRWALAESAEAPAALHPPKIRRPTSSSPATAAVGAGVGAAVLGTAALAVFGPLSLAVGGVVALATAELVRNGWHESRWRRQRATKSRGDVLTPVLLRDDNHPIQRLLALDPRFAGQARAATALSAVSKVLNIVPPVIVGAAIAIVSGGPLAWLASLGVTTVMAQVWAVALVGSAFWTAEAWTELKAGLLWRDLARQMQHELRMRGYRHVQNLEFGVLENRRVGELASILNDDVNQVNVFFDMGAHDAVQLATNLAVIGPLCYIVAPTMGWLAVLPIPLIVWMSFRFEREAGPYFHKMREQAARVNAQLVSNLDGMPVIRSFVAEDLEEARVEQLSVSYAEAQKTPDDLAARFTPAVRMVMLSAWGGTIVGGGYEVAAGAMGPGAYVTFVSVTSRFLWPLVGLGRAVNSYQRTLASATRILDLLEVPAPPKQTGGRRLPRADVAGDVRFENVSFAYSGRAPVFDALTLHFEAGKTSAIVGATGGGKTTLIKLLIRFHEVGSGRILLDGHDLRELDVRDVRLAIGLVAQDPFLFEGTIRDNIAYGQFDADDEDIRRAAELAEVHSFVADLPQGYDTVVGERGVKLSGGQRQRICLARAILKDPAILVLDEATSSVDNETEAAIQRALARITIGRTTIIVAHRLSTVRHADVIYVLDGQGRVAEAGTHSALLRRRGLYASLWAVQSGKPQIEATALEKIV